MWHYAVSFECLMTLGIHGRYHRAPGFLHYVFRDKTSHHVTTRALGRVQLSRSINFMPRSDIQPNARPCVSRCRFCDGDHRAVPVDIRKSVTNPSSHPFGTVKFHRNTHGNALILFYRYVRRFSCLKKMKCKRLIIHDICARTLI